MTPRTFTRTLLALGLVTGVACRRSSADPEAIAVRAIILGQVRRHPLMEPRDLYKLLHQAAMGSEHVMDDTAGVRLWMERELVTMGEGPPEPMIDTIAPGGRVVWVELRPWVAAGRSTDSLLSAFIQTASVIRPDTARLDRYLAVADSVAAEGALPFRAPVWRELVEAQRRGNYPAVHHSDAFILAYRPAYRVVAGSLVPE